MNHSYPDTFHIFGRTSIHRINREKSYYSYGNEENKFFLEEYDLWTGKWFRAGYMLESKLIEYIID